MNRIELPQALARESVAVQFNQSLLLSLDPAATSALAEAPSASSAAELWRQAAETPFGRRLPSAGHPIFGMYTV
jgi:hypothetical protein